MDRLSPSSSLSSDSELEVELITEHEDSLDSSWLVWDVEKEFSVDWKVLEVVDWDVEKELSVDWKVLEVVDWEFVEDVEAEVDCVL